MFSFNYYREARYSSELDIDKIKLETGSKYGKNKLYRNMTDSSKLVYIEHIYDIDRQEECIDLHGLTIYIERGESLDTYCDWVIWELNGYICGESKDLQFLVKYLKN